MGKCLLVIDCESIPDVALLREIYSELRDIDDDLMLCERAFAMQKEATGSSFLPLPFHKIITLSVVQCDGEGCFEKVGNFATKGENADDMLPSEREILETFLRFLNKNNPRLVSFNGRNFDLPTIMLRSLRYNLSAESYFETASEFDRTKNKWENYRARYSENFHIDLLDTLSNFGAVRGLKLDVLCKMAGIVGKFDTKGDDVYKLFYAGQYRQIAQYCQSDVLNTYWLYLKYRLLQGQIDVFRYGELLEIWLEKLPKDKNYSEVFREAITAEIRQLNI